MRARLAGPVWLLLCTAPALLALQDPPPQFRAGVDLIRVDVSVLDRDRQPVRGLTAADFTIRENGRLHEVAAFAEINLPDPESLPPGWMREVAADTARNDDLSEHRLIVILMDDAMVPNDAQMIASARSIGHSVIERLGPRDLAAVVFTRNGRHAQGFTTDKARLAAAVDTFASAGYHPREMGNLKEPLVLAALGTLRAVIETLGSIDNRRKTVVYVSTGLPLEEPGRPTGPLPAVPTVRMPDPSLVLHGLSDAVRAAERASVNFYSVDPGGLDGMRNLIATAPATARAGTFPRASEGDVDYARHYLEFLRSLSMTTGGHAFTGRNEFDSRVSQIFAETGSYYLLGYKSTNDREDGRLRRIDVRVNRRGVTVRARQGYYAPDARARPRAEPPPAVRTALAGLLPKSDLPLTLTAAPVPQRGGGDAAVAVLASLPAAAAGGADTVDLLVHAYDTEGRSHGSDQLRAQVPAQGGDYELHTQLTLRPGRYELRLSADSAAHGTSGSVYQSITVPDVRGDPLTASGVVLSASPAPMSAPRDRFAGLLPFSPTVRRTFSTADRVEGLLRLYQGGAAPLAPVTVRMTITTAGNEVVFDRPLRIGSDEFDGRAHDYRFELPLARLQPGPHLLTLEVTGPASLRRDVRFEVR
jgi:VWFA-related protein